jgi:hypothetical protein
MKAFIRAHCAIVPNKGAKEREPYERPCARELPLTAIVFDTETLADHPSQRLTFGSYAVVARSSDGISYDPVPLESAFFYADEEPGPVPYGFPITLTECVAASDVPWDVISQSEFLERFYKHAVVNEALIVAYNLPFDLSRIAKAAGTARKSDMKGGFSFTLWPSILDGKKRRRRPRLRVKSLGPRKSSFEFSSEDSAKAR